jgi:predicted XRE-type DNA-binding protein
LNHYLPEHTSKFLKFLQMRSLIAISNGLIIMLTTGQESSGSVLTDLGLPPDEAAILQMLADLMADLRTLIKAKKLTRAKATSIFGVTQPRVSDLMRGKWRRFSLVMCIRLTTKGACMSA